MAEEKDFNYVEDVKNVNLTDIIAENQTPAEDINQDAKVETPVAGAETKVDEPLDAEKLRAELKAELDAEYKEREDKLIERAKTETAAELFNRINPNPTEVEKDQVAEFLKEHPEPTWQDAFKFLSNNTKLSKEELKAEILADLNKEVEEEEVKTKTQTEAATKAQEETNKAWNTYWDSQLTELESKGYIPPIKEADNPNDPGRLARVELFTKMNEISTANQTQGKPIVTSLKDIYLDHFMGDKAIGKRQPAGADAPVAGARKAVSGNADKDFSYNEMHKASIYDILAGK